MASAAPASERARQSKHDELISGTAWYGTTRRRNQAGTMAPEPQGPESREKQRE